MTRRNRIHIYMLPAVFLVGCFVESVNGPSSGQPLESLSYSLRVRGAPCAASGAFVHGTGALVADIPTDWQFERASFSAVFNDVPVSGDAIVPPFCPIWLPAPPPSGFKRICVTTPTTYLMRITDEATVNITFRAGPSVGSFPLQFSSGVRNSITPDMCAQQRPTIFPVTIRLAPEVQTVPVLSLWGLGFFSGALLLLGLWRVRLLATGA